jgi:hypothetical protein
MTRSHDNTLAHLGAALALFAAGCSSSDSSGDDTGLVSLALTDAASDELTSLCVDLESIRLTRANGSVVSALPQPIRIDFATLSDVSQVLNVLRLPAGVYTAAEVTLDFTDAEAWIVGETVEATILDGTGNALTGEVTLPITIGGGLSAAATRARILELDFDLDQSVIVDANANTVQVEPSLVARVDRTDPKPFLVAGGLESVDVSGQSFVVELQTLNREPIRDVTVDVTSSTVVQVDGVPAVGTAGLTALSALNAGAWVQLLVTVEPTSGDITADYAEAGVGTYNGGTDIVDGQIVDRVGGAGADATLTVIGHSTNASHTTLQFNTTFTVSTSFSGTTVARHAALTTRDTDDLTVGQRVRLFGALSGTTLDMTSGTSVARVQPTRVFGFANADPSGGVLELDLSRVELRPEATFQWASGGTTPPDPDQLTVLATGLTTGLGITAATAVEARGWFSPIDDATQDFVAVSVTNRDNAPSVVLVADRDMGLAVTPSASMGTFTLEISGTATLGEIAVVDKGFVGTLPLPSNPPLGVIAHPILGFYGVRDRQTGAVLWTLDFEAFVATLETRFAQGAELFNFAAVGAYDDSVNEVTTGLCLVVLD